MAEPALLLAGAAAVVFAVLMLFQRSLYASAMCLLAVLLQTAVLFYLSGGALVAFLQIMIYAGGVMVLIVVSIMSSAPGGSPEPSWGRLSAPGPLAAAGLLLPAVELLLAAGRAAPPAAGPSGPALSPQLGQVLFGPYALATEAVTLLMLLAALGVLGGRRSEP